MIVALHNKGICITDRYINHYPTYAILLFVETHLALSKAIKNLIININRTRSFKC